MQDVLLENLQPANARVSHAGQKLLAAALAFERDLLLV